MSGTDLIPADFSGVGRLFPLPELVMFPHVVQPLRVFEPRYVRMFADALAGDRMLAMALLQPGWEADYPSAPPIHPMVCLGRILSHNEAADGTYTFLLAGAARAQVVHELPMADLPYRRAELNICVDEEGATPASVVAELRLPLLHALQQSGLAALTADPTVRQLLHDQVELGTLTDVIAFAAPLDLHTKLALLQERHIAERARMLTQALRALPRSSRVAIPGAFPPPFSDN